MSTETFTCKYIERKPNSHYVEHNGRTAYVSDQYTEKISIQGDCCTMTIPYWLYKKCFEDQKNPFNR